MSFRFVLNVALAGTCVGFGLLCLVAGTTVVLDRGEPGPAVAMLR